MSKKKRTLENPDANRSKDDSNQSDAHESDADDNFPLDSEHRASDSTLHKKAKDKTKSDSSSKKKKNSTQDDDGELFNDGSNVSTLLASPTQNLGANLFGTDDRVGRSSRDTLTHINTISTMGGVS